MNRIDFLKRLIGVIGLGQVPLSVLLPKRKIFLLQAFVAGFRFYNGMKLLNEMEVNDYIELKREYENEYDECAIALYWQNEKIGFIPASCNEIIARLIDAEALPLLGIITHLNKEVKPWENVVVGIYFLQEELSSLPKHSQYLQKIDDPEYTTLPKPKLKEEVVQNKERLMNDFFDFDTRIINLNTIENVEAKEYYTKYFGHKKVIVNNVEYALVDNDGHYQYMYNNNPIERVVADDGKEYIRFEFVEEIKNIVDDVKQVSHSIATAFK